MSFFQKLGNALSRFMYGRNGSDQLGWASLVLLLVLNHAGDMLCGNMVMKMIEQVERSMANK